MLEEARGLQAELSGDYDAAVRHYRRQMELDRSRTGVYTDIGRVLRLSGDLPAAARELATALRLRPSNANARYELALVHQQAGRASDAVAELRRALETWQDAEPEYARAARAREALDRLLAPRATSPGR